MTLPDSSKMCELPRERLFSGGPGRLRDWELLAVLLGSGIKGHQVQLIAKKLLKLLDSLPEPPTIEALSEIPGIGRTKAAVILAALEFSRRRIAPSGIKIHSPEDAYRLVGYLIDKPQEHLLTLSLNGAHEVICSRVVTVGLANFCQVHPREVFAPLLMERACAVIIVHNHPSGDLTPSKADKEVTERLRKAGALLGIELLDHIIVSSRGYVSLQQKLVSDSG